MEDCGEIWMKKSATKDRSMKNYIESLNYNTTPEIRSNAKELRQKMTPSGSVHN